MLQNILNINGIKTLERAQKESIRGRGFGDVGLPDVGPGDIDYNSPAAQCAASGGLWFPECSRCDAVGVRYIAGPDCQQWFP
ncbi:hypothetical protein [Aquimarina sp. 2201CG5-10]|uniref:hypothetical protein n=1 Tax=Aquimarina callyspongiae TaxID=3098150 RepID=UPI002AB3D764|nr:hypothetical protein [Aquimarina sp. 2201CG5-10]MDY8138624.1 hypothetical protein [Aquimarina sp. 2201CG5-10]